MPLNQECIGKIYPAVTTEVTAEALQKYARAYNDDNPAYFDSGRKGNIIAPPMFAVVVTWNSTMSAVMDPALKADLLRLVHGEQDMRFLAPIRPGDRISSSAKVLGIESKASGETVTVELQATNQAGIAVNHSLFSAFIRGSGGRGTSADASAAEPSRGEPLVSATQTIDADQTLRYADASGDRNPIHVDENVARMAGLGGIIVHGLCTMAFTSKVTIASLCDNDPERLKRLRVRFSRPVRPGQTITTRVWAAGRSDSGTQRYDFETVNSDGQPVIRSGIAEVAGG